MAVNILEKANTKADHKTTYLVIPQSALAFTLELLQKDNPHAKVTNEVKPAKEG